LFRVAVECYRVRGWRTRNVTPCAPLNATCVDILARGFDRDVVGVGFERM
jgi:hypothetical protein